jgi:phosphatidylglycerol:prolipoprotein diacylglycerol transferase
MHPILFRIGPIEVPTYGLLFASGAVVAWWWFLRRARSMGLPQEPVFNAAFYGLLAGIVGAKVTMILVEWRWYFAEPARIFSIETLRSAGVLMGGVMAGAAVFIWYCRQDGLPLFRLGDAIAAPLALGQAFGRFGCFNAGCCHGVATSGFWGIAFPPHARSSVDPALVGVPLVPTQLLEMGADLALVGLLTWLWRRGKGPAGSVFWWYMILYSAARAVIEHWRGDSVRGLWFGDTLSTSQILSIAAIVVGAAMLAHGRRAARATAA